MTDIENSTKKEADVNGIPYKKWGLSYYFFTGCKYGVKSGP